MNFDNQGEPILKIINPKKKKNNHKTLYVSDKECDNFMNEYNTDRIVQPVPLPARERIVAYVTGASGSGKSYYASKLVEEYHKYYPKNGVFLFSPFEDDGTSFNFSWITKIDIKHSDFTDESWDIEDFKDSLIVLDDIESLTNKKVRTVLTDILNLILEAGRKLKVSCIYTSHITMQGHNTRRVLNEMHSLTLFPRAMGNRTIKYILDVNFGFSKDQIQKIKKLKSRWVTIIKSYPNVIVHERGAYVLDN